MTKLAYNKMQNRVYNGLYNKKSDKMHNRIYNIAYDRIYNRAYNNLNNNLRIIECIIKQKTYVIKIQTQGQNLYKKICMEKFI